MMTMRAAQAHSDIVRPCSFCGYKPPTCSLQVHVRVYCTNGLPRSGDGEGLISRPLQEGHGGGQPQHAGAHHGCDVVEGRVVPAEPSGRGIRLRGGGCA